jgi:prepilin-type N-terminal cleavage/methylation domain-containing protein
MTSPPCLPASGAAELSPRAKEGFTLLETLIALTVILFGFMALLVMHTGAIRSGTLAEIQTVAVFLAESKIEEFRVRPPAGFPNNTPVLEYFNRQGKSTTKPEEAFYTRSVTLKQQVPTQFTDEVTVSVSWVKASPLVYISVIPR